MRRYARASIQENICEQDGIVWVSNRSCSTVKGKEASHASVYFHEQAIPQEKSRKRTMFGEGKDEVQPVHEVVVVGCVTLLQSLALCCLPISSSREHLKIAKIERTASAKTSLLSTSSH